MQRNFGTGPGRKFTEGDASGNGVVSTTDLNILADNYGATGGNRNLARDYDRDNDVDGADFLLWQRNLGLPHCASRFEADANKDGDVDTDDNPFKKSEELSELCGALPPAARFSGAAGDDSGPLTVAPGDPADADQDGDIDYDDVQAWLKITAE